MENVAMMEMYIKPAAQFSAGLLELLGMGTILVLAVFSLGHGVYLIFKREKGADIFQRMRHRMVKGILLGLELLVAADIINTVALELTFATVGILAAVVAIRTFLSFTLEVEMTGHWPWNPPPQKWT